MSSKFKAINFHIRSICRSIRSLLCLCLIVSTVTCVRNVAPPRTASIEELIMELKVALERHATFRDIERIRSAMAMQGDLAVQKLAPLLPEQESALGEAIADVLLDIGTVIARLSLVQYSLNTLMAQDETLKDDSGPGYSRLLTIADIALPAAVQRYHQILSADLSYRACRAMAKLIHVAHSAPKKQGLPLIEEGLMNPCSIVVMTAAEARGQVGGPRALEQLVSLLTRSSVSSRWPGKFDYRHGVVAGLSHLGNPAAVEPLFKLLTILPLDAQDPFSIANRHMRPSLRGAIERAIDTLTGKTLSGDPAKIQAWIAEFKGLTPAK